MITLDLFQRKMTDLVTSMPVRDGSDPETKRRNATYFTALRDLNHEDFVEACDRILFEDDWFPTIARIRDVAGICAVGRVRRTEAKTQTNYGSRLVCPVCLGNRWVRLGGYDPLNMHAGEEGSRVIACPDCTVGGVYSQNREQFTIQENGGHLLNDTEHRTGIPAGVQWPQWMDEMRNPLTGKIDMDKLYRKSRELRGLDPLVDARVRNVAGWQSAGSVAARELVSR